MELVDHQRDALTELINIGYGRAAGALSELTGHRILLEVPKVGIYPISEVAQMLKSLVEGEVASVNQVFSGPISGNALLLLDEKAALLLNELLTDQVSPAHAIDSGVREVLTEVGNILLNACLGVFGNLLEVQVSFSVPRMSVDSVERVLNSICVKDEELRYGIMIHTRFRMRDNNVVGYMVIILGITSLDRLLVEMKRWEEREVA